MTISLYYDGNLIGSGSTDAMGVYSIHASIPTPGVYTLKAEFTGTEAYVAAISQARTAVAAPFPALAVAGSIAVAIGLLALATRG